MGSNDYDSNVIMVNRQIGRLTLKKQPLTHSHYYVNLIYYD
jgi:hypothetical protein